MQFPVSSNANIALRYPAITSFATFQTAEDIVDTTRRIMTNTELLAAGLYGYNFTDICTNRMNQTDVYTVYSYKEETQGYNDNRVMIVGIDP